MKTIGAMIFLTIVGLISPVAALKNAEGQTPVELGQKLTKDERNNNLNKYSFMVELNYEFNYRYSYKI